jgi:hypothetical protein
MCAKKIFPDALFAYYVEYYTLRFRDKGRETDTLEAKTEITVQSIDAAKEKLTKLSADPSLYDLVMRWIVGWHLDRSKDGGKGNSGAAKGNSNRVRGGHLRLIASNGKRIE